MDTSDYNMKWKWVGGWTYIIYGEMGGWMLYMDGWMGGRSPEGSAPRFPGNGSFL